MGNVGPTPTGNIFLDTIDQTIDPTLPSPTSQILGSSSGVSDPDGVGVAGVPTNEERGDTLFPFLDGVTNRLTANPVSLDGQTEYLFDGRTPTLSPEFDANGNELTPAPLFPNSVPIPGPDALPVEDFFSFHSSHQLEYIDAFGTDIPVQGGKLLTLSDGVNRFDIVASPDGRRVFILQQLTKADIAIASREDQAALAAVLADLPDDIRTQLESVIGAEVGSEARNTLNQAIAVGEAQINGFFNLENITNNPFNADDVDAARATFVDQINNIKTRTSTSSFISQAEINTRISEIIRRAERADAFFFTSQNPPRIPTVAPEQVGEINSLQREGFAQPTIDNAFKSFIAQETRIRDLDNQRLQLAQTGFLNGGRALDGPNLIAIFQLNYNLAREAEVNAETEELTQQNALLQDYAAIQQLINEALGKFTGDENRNITGTDTGGEVFTSLDQATQDKIAFIDELLSNPPDEPLTDPQTFTDIRNPIEALRGIERPTLDAVSNEARIDIVTFPIFEVIVLPGTRRLKEFTQNQLNIFATQLADTVTQINQESQILTNEISNLNRERNRHFDLANNALRRLNDSLQTIARI